MIGTKQPVREDREVHRQKYVIKRGTRVRLEAESKGCHYLIFTRDEKLYQFF